MLVAALSDTHLPRGARRLPEVVLDAARSADLIVHGGDLSARSVLEELCALGPPVQAVHGNADEAALRERLPKELVLELEETRVGVVHVPGPAAGRGERLRRRFPGCDAVLFGHTHVPVVEREEGVWLLNPGSPTERRRATPFYSFLLIRVHGRELEPELVRLT